MSKFKILIDLVDEQKQKAIERLLSGMLTKYLKNYNPEAKAGVKFENLNITDTADGSVIDVQGQIIVNNVTITDIVLSLLPFNK